MLQTQNVPSIRNELSDRTLTMNLSWQERDIILLRSCEIVGKGFRSRFSFSENKHIENVLVPRLAHAVAVSLRSVAEDTHVLALPEFLIELPGLVLAGLHVMIMEAAQGVRNVILRFKEVLGAANRVFQTDVGVEEPVASQGQQLAINVLEEICLPILNLCHAIDAIASDEGQTINPQLKERAQEFVFQTELLKRFVANAAVDSDGRALRDSRPTVRS